MDPRFEYENQFSSQVEKFYPVDFYYFLTSHQIKSAAMGAFQSHTTVAKTFEKNQQYINEMNKLKARLITRIITHS